MHIHEANEERKRLNGLMGANDDFFAKFGALDDDAYGDGAIPRKYKELTGLSISVFCKCNECILYHIQGCVAAGADKGEIIEAIKIGVIGAGSVTYPNARYAFQIMEQLKIL